MMLHIVRSTLLVIVIVFEVHAQEQMGIRASNLGGIHSVLLNPSGSQHYPMRWDVNVAGGGFFFNNNYAFFQETSIAQLAGASGIIEHPQLRGIPEANSAILDYYRRDEYKLSFSAEVMGPSFMYHINEQSSAGLFSRLRMAGGSNNIPGSLGYYQYNGLDAGQPEALSPTSFVAFSWLEVGGNYARTMPTYRGYFTWGVTAKYLRSYDAFFGESYGSISLVKNEDYTEITLLDDVDIEYTFASSVLDEEEWIPTSTGRGFAIDIGVQGSIDAPTDDRPYLWKYGFSVLDLGWVKLNTNYQTYSVEGGKDRVIDLTAYEVYEHYADADDILDQFNRDILGSAEAAKKDAQSNMGMPMALSAQVDRSLGNDLFLGAVLVEPIPVGGSQRIQRPSSIALLPRYERKAFEVSLPLTWLEREQLLIGFSARLAFLHIGTNDLAGTLFGKNELNSANVYAALRLMPFLNKKKKDSFSNKEGKCPKFD